MVELSSALPFNILALYISIAMTIGILGIFLSLRKIAGSPFITIFSAIMIWGLIAIINNIAVDYVDDVTYSLSYPMNVTTGVGNVPFSTTTFGITEHPVNTDSLLYNAKFSCIDIDLSKTLAPTGLVTIGVFDSSNMVIKQFGTIDATLITTTQRQYQFCLPSHDYWTLSLYDYVGAKHTTSTATDFVKVHVDSAGPFDSTRSVRSSFTTLWTDTSTADLRMKLISDNVNVYGKEVPYDLNDNDVYVYLIFLGGFFMWMGIMMQIRDWK